MAWFKVDDGFANSRPILAIPRRYRTQAAGLWVLAGTWSAKELTDGFIPDYLLDELASTPAIAKWLVSAGLWRIVPGGYQLIGWEKYQFTKEQVLARRKAEAEKKQRARDAARKAAEQRSNKDVPQGVPGGHSGESLGESLGESALPDPTRPDQTRTHLSLVTSGGDVALVDAPEPSPRCESHLLEKNPPRCGRCADARKLHDAWVKAQQEKRQAVMAARREAIDACGICDERGMVERPSGLDHCDHQEAAHA